MTRTETLPTPSASGHWWGTETQVSRHLAVEAEAMRRLFNPAAPTRLNLPRSSWDVRQLLLITHRLTLDKIPDYDHDLGWTANFAMDDGGRLANPRNFYTLKLFYPRQYPFAHPDLVLLGPSGSAISSPEHMNLRIKVAGTTYRTICHSDHSDHYFTGHDSSTTTGQMHALRAIMWLRSHLYAQKHHRRHMPTYG